MTRPMAQAPAHYEDQNPAYKKKGRAAINGAVDDKIGNGIVSG